MTKCKVCGAEVGIEADEIKHMEHPDKNRPIVHVILAKKPLRKRKKQAKRIQQKRLSKP